MNQVDDKLNKNIDKIIHDMIQVAIDDEIVPPRSKENPKEDLQVRKKKKKKKRQNPQRNNNQSDKDAKYKAKRKSEPKMCEKLIVNNHFNQKNSFLPKLIRRQNSQYQKHPLNYKISEVNHYYNILVLKRNPILLDFLYLYKMKK